MPRTSPEYQGKTYNRRVYPLHLRNENAGLLAIDPPAFQKVNIAPNTINSTLTSPVQGNQVLPVPVGKLGGSYWALKAAGLAGDFYVPVTLFSLAPGNPDPYDDANIPAYPEFTEIPLGIVMHDLAGSRYDAMGGEDTELTANYYDGQGAYFDMFVYETNERVELVDGDPYAQATVYNHTGVALTYAKGQPLFVDLISGLLTNRLPRSVASPEAVAAGAYAAPVFGAGFVEATMTALYGTLGFDLQHVINGVCPFPVAEVIDLPTAEYPVLRIRTLI